MIGSVFGAGNRVTLSVENQPLGKVLQRIEKASGMDVVLSDQKWAKDPVSFSVKNSDVEKALDSALRPYDYVLEWYAGETDFSKVVVTVHERKSLVFANEKTVKTVADHKISAEVLAAMDAVAEQEKKMNNKARLINGLGISEEEYQEMVRENKRNM